MSIQKFDKKNTFRKFRKLIVYQPTTDLVYVVDR